MNETCRHELPKGTYALCVPGGTRAVFVTRGGSHYHLSRSCRTLRDGQAEADRRGLNTHPITLQLESHAVVSGRSLCRNCRGTVARRD